MKLRIIAIAAVIALIAVTAAMGREPHGRELAARHADRQGRDAEGRPRRLRHGGGQGQRQVRLLGDQGVEGQHASTAAHIHKGGPGVAGPVVVAFGGAYKAKGCTTTTAMIAAAIKKSPGKYYVNVHNAKYPGGALRGQLASGTSSTPHARRPAAFMPFAGCRPAGAP